MNPESSSEARGLTPTSFVASIAALSLTALITQWVEVVLFTAPSAELALPLPGVLVLAFLVATASFAGLVRLRWLTKPELVTVYFILAISSPLMTQGFWQRIVSISKTLPQAQDFSKFDSLSSRLWPHGRNYFPSLSEAFQLSTTRLTEGVRMEGSWIVLQGGTGDSHLTRIRFEVPLKGHGFEAGESVMVCFLLKLEGFAAESLYSAGFRVPEDGRYLSVAEGRTAGRPNPVLQEGVTRVGQYNVLLPNSRTGAVDLEISIRGPGTLQISDLRLFSVAALEAMESGVQTVSAVDLESVPVSDRARTLLEPSFPSCDWFLHRLGIGLIPWEDWWKPIALWTLLLVTVLAGSFGVNLLMRSRWVDSERIPLPLTRIPLMMLGEPLQAGDSPVLFWRNPLMWAGFGVAFVWAALRGWHFYNPGVPDLTLLIPLQSYFDPGWGRTWEITFSVSLVIVAMAVFVDSSVLLSVVVGFFLYRLLFYFGMTTGWDARPQYPYASYQQIGAFMVYGVMLLFMARRQLVSALRTRGDGARTGLGLVFLSLVGAAVWGWLCQMAPWQTILWVTFLLMIALVSSRFRAECGTPMGYFTPTNSSYIFFLFGGFSVFGHDFLLTTYMFSYVLLSAVFFLIPGAQFEYMEVSRRMRIPIRHMLGASFIGVFGGVLIGGLVFLLVAYSFGAVSLVNSWTLSTKMWYFNEFNAEMAKAASLVTTQGGTDPDAVGAWSGVAYGGIGVTVISLLRQMVSSFWFHPFGFIVGSTPFASELWGSILTAWGIRMATLKLGGSLMLRNGLQPVFGGVFLGALAAWALFAVIGTIVLGSGSPLIYSRIP